LFQQVFPEARIGDEKAIEFARRRYNRELYRRSPPPRSSEQCWFWQFIRPLSARRP